MPAHEPRRTKLKAPDVFSLMENPVETLEFFAKFDAVRKTHDQLFVDLEQVRRLTPDALLLLISRLGKKRGQRDRCVSVGGNEPTDPKVKAVLVQSGFYSHVSDPPKDYNAAQNSGILIKHAGKRVREDVCSEIVRFATNRVLGFPAKNGGLYRTLIEAMANTKDHATPNSMAKPQSWWVSVFFDEDTKVAHFAFLDNGVGIFKSVKMQGVLKQLGRFLGVLTYVDLLNDILDAKLGSRTGLPYRGKGLPSIRKAMERGQIRNLRLITNTAYLDASTRRGRILENGFRGTCLTWELHP